MARGTLDTVRDGGDALASEKAASEPPPTRDAVTYERFNLHAAVALAAHDDLGRERLCRYLTRPPFALGRLQQRRDGTVIYRVKKAGRGCVRVRVMTPVELLARLAAIVPPPRYPLLRFHGVLAPRHAWRSRVVPQAPAPSRSRCTPAHVRGEPETARESALRRRPCRARRPRWGGYRCAALALSSRVDWATLLRRTFDLDVRICPRCSGRVTVRAVVTDPASVRKLLTALRRPRAPPAAA